MNTHPYLHSALGHARLADFQRAARLAQPRPSTVPAPAVAPRHTATPLPAAGAGRRPAPRPQGAAAV